MRAARLVGPTADGTSVVLLTDDGEELTLRIDERTRALLGASDDPPPPASAQTNPVTTPAGRPPRRRETPLDQLTPLSPRDIQSRIRSGESVEDVVAESGMDADRVERFAAPVIAEREHMALTALGSSVRRRGEGSGARPLRAVVAERLLGQGVDADDVVWDAWKDDDNHWQVVADYELGGESRRAEFRFDAQSRFSLAVDDDARWLAGERPSPVAAALDRDDELALVRATQDETQRLDELGQERVAQTAADELGAVLQVVPPVELSEEELDELVADDPESDDAGLLPVSGSAERADEPAADDELFLAGSEEDDPSTGSAEPTLVSLRDEAAEPTIAVVRHLTRVTVEVDEPAAEDAAAAGPEDPQDARSALDTLYDMLGGDGYAEESTRVYAGLTDAAAVPVVDEHEFEPAADVLVPAEPDADPESEDDETADSSDLQEQDAAPETEPADDAPEPLIPAPGASRKPGRRKRASVPSWDEIMFGGPKRG